MKLQNYNYQVNFPAFEAMQIRPLDMSLDLHDLHVWVNSPHARFWGMQGQSLEQVRDKYQGILDRKDYEVYIGSLVSTGEKIFMLECYDVDRDIIKDYYPVKPGDQGFHMFVAPSIRPIPNITYFIFLAVLEYMFQDPAVQRIIGEPDLRNEKVLMRLVQGGFRFGRVIHLPYKTAWMIYYTREDLNRANRMAPPKNQPLPWYRGLHLNYHMLVGRIGRKLGMIKSDY